VIEKRRPEAIAACAKAQLTSGGIDVLQNKSRSWFPGWTNHALWCDSARFIKIIVEGCWPLHPAATWFLYRLASVGKSLQQRSAVSLLEEAIAQHHSVTVPDGRAWSLPAATLCSDTVVQELVAAENYGQQAAFAHAFMAV